MMESSKQVYVTRWILAAMVVWAVSGGCCSKSEPQSGEGATVQSVGAKGSAPMSVEDETALKASELLKRGEAEKARDLARDALKNHPEHIDLHRVYQDAMRALEHQDALKKEYVALLDKHPNSALYEYLAGRSVILEDPVDAEMHFRKGIERDPAFLWNYLALGALRSRNGDNFAAIQTYEKALERFPKSADLYFNLAEANYSIGAHRNALEAAEKAVNLDPDHALATELIAKVHLARGVNDEAARAAKRALAIDPDLGGANRVMAEVLLKDGNVDVARKYALKALEAGEDLPLPLRLKLQLEVPSQPK